VHKNNIQFSLFIKIIIFRDMKEECVEIIMYFPQTKYTAFHFQPLIRPRRTIFVLSVLVVKQKRDNAIDKHYPFQHSTMPSKKGEIGQNQNPVPLFGSLVPCDDCKDNEY